MRADGEGGIFFYIILGLVGLIVSYLQNKAKPKPPVATDDEIPDDSRDIWKELVDWEEEKDHKEVEPKVLYQEPVKPVEVSTVEGPVIMDAMHEGVSAFTHKPETAESAYRITEHPVAYYADFIKDTEITDIVEEQAYSEKFVFNPREAVIYSEILNRKY